MEVVQSRPRRLPRNSEAPTPGSQTVDQRFHFLSQRCHQLGTRKNRKWSQDAHLTLRFREASTNLDHWTHIQPSGKKVRMAFDSMGLVTRGKRATAHLASHDIWRGNAPCRVPSIDHELRSTHNAFIVVLRVVSDDHDAIKFWNSIE